MARFLGDVSGRTSVPYTDNAVNTACSNLCSYVNTVCSNINTAKLSCTGNGSAVTGIVTSLTAGSGITVNQSTGAVTISASAGGSTPTILYNCACYCGCCAGACIPAASRGAYQRYEIMGTFCAWNYYCSQFTANFAGACGGTCACNNYGCYCCAMASCGSINQFKCFMGSYQYSCAGAIAWPFGCSSGCHTSCAPYPFQFHAALMPVFPCCGGNRCFSYCFRTTGNGSNNYGNYCYGITNTGKGIPCCGAHPACLQCICFTTPSASTNFSGTLMIVGYGRIV